MASEFNSLQSSTQIPKKINPFSELKSIKNDHESYWLILEQAVNKIFNNSYVDINLESLYRIVENFNPEINTEIFNNLRQLCLRHVGECAPKLYKDDSTDELFLNHITSSWKEYCMKIEIIRSIFLFVDRKLWSINSNLMSFWDMAMQLWRDMYINGPLLNKEIILCLKQIHNQRDGLKSDLSLSKAVAQMFIDLDLYQRFWEPKYLDEARSYYTQESEKKLSELSGTDYLVYGNTRLEEENERSQMYLSGDSIRIQLRDQLVNIILKPQLNGLLKSGFNEMMEKKDLFYLELLYNLAQLVNSKSIDSSGISIVRNYFREYVMKSGTVIVENSNDDVEKDKKMTQHFLDLKAHLDSVVEKCFKGDMSFYKTIRDCFEAFLNARPNKPAEYLAKFLDSKLRSGNKNLTEEAMESIMDKVMTLFRFITGKDVFEAFYLKDLAKRLLMGKSACVDTEKAMLEKLKHECGPNYTRKMEIMFSDIENSQRLSKQFSDSNYIQNLPDKDLSKINIEMNVSVICNATWPSLGGSKLLNIPQYMIDMQNAFSGFYKTNHNGRKLRFEPSLGTCIVRGYFPKGRKELQVSEFQCMVLLQFNRLEEMFLTYTDIEKAVGMEPDMLKKTLLSLSVGKGQRVLIKRPSTIKLNRRWLCTYGAPSMQGRDKGFIAHVLRQNSQIKIVHCMIHREVLVSKSLSEKLLEAMDNMMKVVNYIKSSALRSRMFSSLCDSTDLDFKCLLYHTEVRWLSKGKVLSRFIALKVEIISFFETDKMDLNFLHDDIWWRKITFLNDVFEKLNHLNMNIQDECENIIFTGKLKSFEEKLQFWKIAVENKKLDSFPGVNVFCQKLKNLSGNKENNSKSIRLIEKIFSDN